MKISELQLPSKGEISTYFIAGDWHTEAMSISCFKIMLAMASTLPKKKRKLIINGDFLDAPHLMPRSSEYKKYIGRADGIEEYFLPISEEEFTWGNTVLDRLQKVFHEIIYVEGNHDWRYRDFMKVAPGPYAHNFDYRLQLSLDKRNIDYVNYNDWLDIGDIWTITHGMYHGTTCLKKHYEAARSRNVIFSHVHSDDRKSFVGRGDTVHAYSLPAFSNLNPGYIKNRETNWDMGFATLNVRDDGKCHYNSFVIRDDKLVLPNGKAISGH